MAELGCDFFSRRLSARRVGSDTVELEITDDLRGPAGSLHGGLVAMLIDVAGASCLAAAAEMRPVATAGVSVQYLAPGRVGPVRATATVLRSSEHLGVAEVRVVDTGRDDRLMAVAHLTARYLPGDAFRRSID